MAKGICEVITAEQGLELVAFLKNEWDLNKPKLKKTVSKMSKKQSLNLDVENLYDFLKENFVTK